MLTTSATSEYRSQIVVEHAPHVRTVTFRLGKRTYHFSWGLRRDSNYRQLLSRARTSTSVLADLCRRAALNINDLPRGNGIWRIDDKSQGRLINYAPRKRRAISRWSGNRQTEKRNAYENVGVFVRRYRWSDKRGKPSVIVIRLHKLSTKFGNGKIPWSGVRVGVCSRPVVKNDYYIIGRIAQGVRKIENHAIHFWPMHETKSFSRSSCTRITATQSSTERTKYNLLYRVVCLLRIYLFRKRRRKYTYWQYFGPVSRRHLSRTNKIRRLTIMIFVNGKGEQRELSHPHPLCTWSYLGPAYVEPILR